MGFDAEPPPPFSPTCPREQNREGILFKFEPLEVRGSELVILMMGRIFFLLKNKIGASSNGRVE